MVERRQGDGDVPQSGGAEDRRLDGAGDLGGLVEQRAGLHGVYGDDGAPDFPQSQGLLGEVLQLAGRLGRTVEKLASAIRRKGPEADGQPAPCESGRHRIGDGLGGRQGLGPGLLPGGFAAVLAGQGDIAERESLLGEIAQVRRLGIRGLNDGLRL